MEGGGVEEMNKAIDNLTQASHKLAEAMYRAPARPRAAERRMTQPEPPEHRRQAATGPEPRKTTWSTPSSSTLTRKKSRGVI